MKEKDKNTEFLNYIYQNAQMGAVTIDGLYEKVENVNFKTIIKKQREEYKNICDDAIKIFIKYGKDEKEIGAMAKISGYIMNAVKTLTDSSTNNLAKMTIEGSNKGILEIQEKLNKYTDEDREIVRLAEKLLALEKRNIEELKQFL